MKYQVGDTVIVRNDIEENELCYMENGVEHAVYTPIMKGRFGGKAVTINRISLGCYHIKEDYAAYF